ncbi:hypothetical protein JZ751_026083 [Albula glossodonta]|uniref:Uncharacterized protein n=1 Tax=Albula glossodonta TaxID=121402 RepID=A0A8T2NL23_9TELE|nr:hypothetical protein JZ751_026083 [Albula glossodonta]
MGPGDPERQSPGAVGLRSAASYIQLNAFLPSQNRDVLHGSPAGDLRGVLEPALLFHRESTVVSPCGLLVTRVAPAAQLEFEVRGLNERDVCVVCVQSSSLRLGLEFEVRGLNERCVCGVCPELEFEVRELEFEVRGLNERPAALTEQHSKPSLKFAQTTMATLNAPHFSAPLMDFHCGVRPEQRTRGIKEMESIGEGEGEEEHSLLLAPSSHMTQRERQPVVRLTTRSGTWLVEGDGQSDSRSVRLALSQTLLLPLAQRLQWHRPVLLCWEGHTAPPMPPAHRPYSLMISQSDCVHESVEPEWGSHAAMCGKVRLAGHAESWISRPQHSMQWGGAVKYGHDLQIRCNGTRSAARERKAKCVGCVPPQSPRQHHSQISLPWLVFSPEIVGVKIEAFLAGDRQVKRSEGCLLQETSLHTSGPCCNPSAAEWQ